METCDVKVSICCLTYNHEKYIRQALDSFLMQKTNFKYEILIHDDASIDNTANIIREYEEKYPDIIKPIYQTENQYSKHIQISWKYQFSRAKGKYIAMCEGDDFWSDEKKLQCQYDVLENNNAVFCTHQVQFVTESGEITDIKKPNKTWDYYQLGDEFLCELMKKDICPFQLSSYMFRRDAIEQECKAIPEFIKIAPVGDVTLMMLLATKGDICYMNRNMSCYRMFSDYSWSLSQERDKTNKIKHEEGLCEAFVAFNKYTNYNYHELVFNQINKRKFRLFRLKGEYDKLFKPPFLEMIRQLSIKEQVYIVCSAKIPILMKIYKIIKRNLTKY